MQYPTIPIRKALPGCEVKWQAGCESSDPDAILFTKGKPFFHILTDNGIAALFLDTVTANPEEALAFVSKHYVGAIDLEALRDTLARANRLCNSWVQAPYNANPKNCLTSSVLLVDREHNTKRLLHLHMIREPDRYGQWKIYGIDQE
ncbi:MAG: hypothetical protein LBR83_00525 [Clostridiales bacterium]|nr:hypothetical protein [Clostridiales bacterium]